MVYVDQNVDEETVARAEYTAGLRQIADLLDEHPEVPLPYLDSYVADQHGPALYIYLLGEAGALTPIARAMGRAEKHHDEHLQRMYLYRHYGSIRLVASIDRAKVCERVVVGTEEVTEYLPDPEAVQALPKVAVTHKIERVEWVCGPVLAAEAVGELAGTDG